MMTRININGTIKEEVFISVFDHGFLFGDSIYEVICTSQGKPCFLNEHLNRLYASASGISLEIPNTSKEIKEQIQNTLNSADNDESYIRIIVTRGIGEVDIDPSSCLVQTKKLKYIMHYNINMFLSINSGDFNPHYIIISEKTKNNIMAGSDFYRLIFSDEYVSTNGLFINFDLKDINIEKYFNKINQWIKRRLIYEI